MDTHKKKKPPIKNYTSKKTSLLLADVIAEIEKPITKIIGVSPSISKPLNVVLSKEFETLYWMHYRYFVNIYILKDRKKKDMYFLSVSFYGDLRPTVTANITLTLSYLNLGLNLVISDFFAYSGKENKLIWADDAEEALISRTISLVKHGIQSNFEMPNPTFH